MVIWFLCILISFHFFVSKVSCIPENTSHSVSNTKAWQSNGTVKCSQIFKNIGYSISGQLLKWQLKCLLQSPAAAARRFVRQVKK